MRRLKKTTVLSAVLAGCAILFFILFAMSGTIIPLVLAFLLLLVSGFARKKESYDEYRDRYEDRFGMDPEDGPDKKKKS